MYEVILYSAISGSAVLLGAFLGLRFNFSKKFVAYIMGFGSGVLMSAVSIDLMSDAYEKSKNPVLISIFALMGALFFVFFDYLIDNAGGKHRRTRDAYATTKESSGLSLFLGTLLDGIPESIVLGITIANGGAAGIVFCIAIFLSNFPEGLSGTIGMRHSGLQPIKIVMMWTATVILSIAAAVVGYIFLGSSDVSIIVACMSFASGAVLAVLCDTMIPEAFELGGRWIALVTVSGFLIAFLLSEILKV